MRISTRLVTGKSPGHLGIHQLLPVSDCNTESLKMPKGKMNIADDVKAIESANMSQILLIE